MILRINCTARAIIFYLIIAGRMQIDEKSRIRFVCRFLHRWILKSAPYRRDTFSVNRNLLLAYFQMQMMRKQFKSPELQKRLSRTIKFLLLAAIIIYLMSERVYKLMHISFEGVVNMDESGFLACCRYNKLSHVSYNFQLFAKKCNSLNWSHSCAQKCIFSKLHTHFIQ